MRSEFEEKQYEVLTDIELLDRNTRLIYPPGQVLEGMIGFDVALRTGHPRFWDLFPPAPRPGVRLDRRWWQEWPQMPDMFPRIRFNVFIQYKRPEHITSCRGAEWPGWRRPYYRYDLTQHLQQALANLERRVGGEAVITYACPAFHTLADLWDASRSGQLVENSNFAQPSSLAGHSRYSYVEPGRHGRRHSKGEPVTSEDLKGRLDELASRKENRTSKQVIIDLGKAVSAAIDEAGPAVLVDSYHQMVSYMAEDVSGIPVAKALVRLDVFCWLTRSVWRMGCAEPVRG